MMRYVRAALSIVLLGWGIPSVGAQGVPSSLAPAPDSLPGFEVLALERVPPEAQASVVAADMPVLLLDAESLLGELVFSVGVGWYAASMTGDGYSVLIEGTRRVFQLPDLVAEGSMGPRRQPLRISRMDGIVEATFVVERMSYSIAIECERPDQHPKCVDDSHLEELLTALRAVEVGP